MSDDTEEWTALYDAEVPEMHMVGKGANGFQQFLIVKQDAGQGLMPPAYVRSLIEKADAETADVTKETVTMSGSPAAIAALIHGATMRKTKTVEPDPAEPLAKAGAEYAALVKAKYNAADLKRMAANGQAMSDQSYPIADKEDLGRAIRAVGRGGASHDAIRRHIITRAKSLGASGEIPDDWNADGSLAKASGDAQPKDMEVTKDMDTMDPEALDPTVLLAEPEGDDAPGNPAEPGSPAWESIDAATARKWTAILARARAALEMMSDRENLEAATADPDDAEAAMDLDDAACAIDYAISILAPFAVDEQAEADCCDDDTMGMIGKALGAFDAAPLEVIESLTQVRKAGRVLSASNEAAIRGAVESLQKVLASLPAAPTADTDGGQAVAKTANEEPEMPENTPSSETTETSGQQPAMGTASPEPKPVAGEPVTEMAKADDGGDGKTPMVAVYDADGNLVGIVDPTEITPIQGAKKNNAAPAGQDDDAAGSDGGQMAEPAADDLTPQPAADAGTPADAPAPSEDDDSMTKAAQPAFSGTPDSNTEALIKAALDEHSATQAELVKGLEEKNQALEERYAQLEKRLAESEERLTTVENQPAVSAIFANGAVPPAHHLRGQDHGAPVQVTKAQEMRSRFTQATDAVEAAKAADAMQAAAIDAFTAMRQRP